MVIKIEHVIWVNIAILNWNHTIDEYSNIRFCNIQLNIIYLILVNKIYSTNDTFDVESKNINRNI